MTATALPDNGRPHWTYDEAETWGEIPGYETCGTGQQQTPIDISSTGVVILSGAPAFRNYGAIPLVIEQNGHTLQVDYVAKNDGTDPQFDFGGKTYVLAQFHLHSPSEHHVDGNAHDGELHMVHKAADGSLAVIGVFLDEGAENAQLAKVLVNAPPTKTQESCDATLDLSAIVPVHQALWNYGGSLTTPPCTEGVNWFISPTPITLSPAQHDDFVARTSPTSNRPIQELDGRVINRTTTP
jgi:carbonic anhydrase